MKRHLKSAFADVILRKYLSSDTAQIRESATFAKVQSFQLSTHSVCIHPVASDSSLFKATATQLKLLVEQRRSAFPAKVAHIRRYGLGAAAFRQIRQQSKLIYSNERLVLHGFQEIQFHTTF